MAEEVHSSPFPLERWLKLAETKLKSGYVVLVHPERRNARFFKRGYGYEPCPYQAAFFLMQSGYLVVAKESASEITYRLAEGVTHIEAGKIFQEEPVEDDDVDFSDEDEEELAESDFDDEELEEPADEDE